MIKLPSVTSLPAARAPDLSGQIAAKQQVSRGVSGVMGAAVQAVTEEVENFNRQQLDEAYAKANNAMHDYDERNAGKQFYSGDEIPEGIDVKKTEIVVDDQGNEVEQIRERIPAYEVQSQMRDQYQRTVIKSAAEGIRSDSGRNQFSMQMNERANAQHIKMVEHSRKEQYTQIREQQTLDLEKALLDRDYETASYLANNFNGSSTERKELTQKVDYFHESDTYNDVMSEENMVGIDRSIAKLEQDGYSGNLNEVQRLATLNQLRSKKSQIQTKRKKALEGSTTMLGVEIDRTIDAMETGKDVPPSQISRLNERVQAGIKSGLISGDTWEKRMAFFQEATKYMPELTKFKTMPLQEQEAQIRQMQNDAQTGSDWHKIDIWQKNHNQAKTALRDDPVNYASEVGVTDVKPFDFANLRESLIERQGVRANMMVTFGPNAGNKFWSKQELSDFTNELNKSSTEEKMRTLSIITGTLDSASASAALSQLAGSNSGVYSVAGDLLMQNQPEIARSVLNGGNIIKAEPDIVKDWNLDATPVIFDALGNSFDSSPKTKKLMMEAVRLNYAELSYRAGDHKGVINQDRLNVAIQNVTGSIIDYNGSKLSMPQRDMTQADFDTWVRDIQPAYLDSLGGVKGFSGKTGAALLKYQIRNGDIVLQNVGKDKYAMRGEGGFLINKDTGNAFILQYNPDATLRSRW